MSLAHSILPEGEMLGKAAQWISDKHTYDLTTIEEACVRFDLSPLDEEFLLSHFWHADESKLKSKGSS